MIMPNNFFHCRFSWRCSAFGNNKELCHSKQYFFCENFVNYAKECFKPVTQLKEQWRKKK
jgi:hypothetical protein